MRADQNTAGWNSNLLGQQYRHSWPVLNEEGILYSASIFSEQIEIASERSIAVAIGIGFVVGFVILFFVGLFHQPKEKGLPSIGRTIKPTRKGSKRKQESMIIIEQEEKS